jgi:integrase
MPRSIKSNRLATRTSRLTLPISKKPIYEKIGVGVSLGYRRNKTAGSWVLRIADGKGSSHIQSIALADDCAETNDSTILTFWQAQEAARARVKPGPIGSAPTPIQRPVTVADALDAYESDLQARDGDPSNVARARLHTKDLLRKPIVALNAKDLSCWRNTLAKTLAKATVNRIATCLRASLNLAMAHDERIVTDRSWKQGLKAFDNADRANNVTVDESTIRAIIAAAYDDSPEFGLLIEVAAITGSRYSQLVRVQVRDLAGDRLMVPVSRKGRGVKTTTHTPVPIPAQLGERLGAMSASRALSSPLLLTAAGAPWGRSADIARPFALAARAAGQDSSITMYCLRHTNIVRLIKANVPIRIIAAVHDTSVRMIERNYSEKIAHSSDDMIRNAMLDTSNM